MRVWSQTGSGPRKFYIFDGDTLLGEVNAAGSLSAAYTWGSNGLVSERISSTNKSLWYHFGPQGETRQLTDSTGAVADTYAYTVYGVPTATTGADANPFRYGGQAGYYTDGNAAGVVLCTYRWYSPDMGRWLTRDPISYEGGHNLYGYCAGDPVNLFDPLGLSSPSFRQYWYAFWNKDTWRTGLKTGVAAVGHSLSGGLWQPARSIRRSPGYRTSLRIARVGAGAACSAGVLTGTRVLVCGSFYYASLMGRGDNGSYVVGSTASDMASIMRNFYRIYHRNPTKAELKDIGIEIHRYKSQVGGSNSGKDGYKTNNPDLSDDEMGEAIYEVIE